MDRSKEEVKTAKRIGMFQWSHFFSEMEMMDRLPAMVIQMLRFNGATSFQKWK
jgi:hypothetical protein